MIGNSQTPYNETRKILDEDTYLENLSQIIERDFFPDLPRLREELGINPDTSSATPSVCITPSRFDTPSNFGNISTRSQNSAIVPITPTNVGKLSKAQLKKISLNQYLNTYISEDNVSFLEIMKDNEKKFKEKHPWLFKDVQVEDNTGSNKPVMWNFVAQNALMFVPNSLELSESEKLQKRYQKKLEICYNNSKLPDNFYPETPIRTKPKRAGMAGKIGIDGNEIIPTETPKIGTYNFMVTPSPAPGVNASPLMTWGEIDGTPYKLDGSFTPAPSFKMPEIPLRDKVLKELKHKYGRANKAKKIEALKQAAASFGGTQKSHMTRSEKILSMSPAAQKLMNTKFHISINSPFTSTPGRSPCVTPFLERTPKGITTPKSLEVDQPNKRPASLTDDLLKLPVKKARASDFF